MGGIYGGVFTATEGAGIGAFGALMFAIARRALTWATFLDSLVESARTTAMLFAILTGAFIFTEFINYTSMPDDLKRMVTGLSPFTVIAIITVIYLILGMVMEELAMVLLTVPVLFPLIVHLGFDPIWFGIYIVVRGRDRHDQPARRHEPVRRHRAAEERPDRHALPRHHSVLHRRRHPSGHPDRLPDLSLWLPSFMK